MVLQPRTGINRFRMVAAVAIGMCFLCAPHALGQPAESTASGDPVLTAQLDLPDTSMMESGIAPAAMVFYRKAVEELHQGKSVAAEKDACRAAQTDEKFADADALAATAALAQRRFARALTEANAAVQIDPKDEKAWVILATADNYLAQYGDALDALRHVAAEHWTTWQVAYQWARAETGLDDGAQTLDWANRAALTAPSSFAPLHLLRASALLAVGDNAQSADELEVYLQLLNQRAPERAELTRELKHIRALPAQVAVVHNALEN